VIIGANLPNYDKSCIVIKEWDKPKIDVDSGIEWYNWLKNNQPFYMEDYFEKYLLAII
jgi:hypothetical protein